MLSRDLLLLEVGGDWYSGWFELISGCYPYMSAVTTGHTTPQQSEGTPAAIAVHSMCVCICVYMCMHACVCVYARVWVCVRVYMHVCYGNLQKQQPSIKMFPHEARAGFKAGHEAAMPLVVRPPLYGTQITVSVKALRKISQAWVLFLTGKTKHY